MTNEQEFIRKALSPLRASEDTLEEVMKMTAKKHPAGNARRGGKFLLVAAVLVVALTMTAFAADYVVNQREVFFFDTLEAMAAAQRTDQPGETAGYAAVPGSAEENADMETVPEGVVRKMEYGRYGDETVLSDETGAGTMWERRRVTESVDEDYGRLTNEYLTGAAYAERLVVEGLLDWELSALEEEMTPEDGGQIIVTSRSADGEIAMVHALLGYTTAEGKRFQIEYSYDVESRYLQEKEYVLSSAYDECYVYTTADQTAVLIEAYDGQIWASAVNVEAGDRVSFYTTGCTTAELEAILDGLNLAVPLHAA